MRDDLLNLSCIFSQGISDESHGTRYDSSALAFKT